MSEVRIENWSLADYPDDPYCPPEHRTKVLVGQVYGYPGRPDGEKIRSSAIVPALSSGTCVVTRSGTCFRLGAIDLNYLDWLTYAGFVFDPAEPIAFGKPARRIER